MAIVDLGTLDPRVGMGRMPFDPIPFVQSSAYGIGFNISVANESSIFSFLRVWFFVSVSGQPSFYDSDTFDIPIKNGIQLVKFPCSGLYRGDGTISPTIERIAFAAGAGDGQIITVNALYDDASTVPSWRN